MTSTLKQKIVVVTGASSGIGREIALSLASQGATLVLVGRRIARLREVAALCAGRGAVANCYKADLLSPADIRSLGRQVIRDWGDIDILIHSAGIIRRGEISDARIEDFDTQYHCNVRAPFQLTQIFLPGLKRNRGQIVFINSTCGLVATGGVAQYAATKHALKALADSIRDEVNSLGIRVVSFYLGRTATPMQARLHRLEKKLYHPDDLIQPEQVSSAVVSTLLMGREAEVMDIRIRPSKKPHSGTVHGYNTSKKRLDQRHPG